MRELTPGTKTAADVEVLLVREGKVSEQGKRFGAEEIIGTLREAADGTLT